MIYTSFVSKSAGGSLKAICPFSPIPINPTSTGDFLISSVSFAIHSHLIFFSSTSAFIVSNCDAPVDSSKRITHNSTA